ncbi:MAG: hypothetical protein JWO36_2952 [Myxococcales bacterium]|nr:hypothetical protein [Myxococcales bacterium]
MRSAVITFSILGLSLLAGCPDRSISKVDPQQGRVEYKDIPVKINRKIDLLFVIDDSPSMADKQTNLKANFMNFINVLNTIEGGLPDVHIGVVTSDLGTKGADDAMPGPAIGSGPGACANLGKAGNLRTDPSVTGPYISDSLAADGVTRVTNYTGSLVTAFSALATAGANGCGFEQHIEAAKRALVSTNTANAGFLRSDAYLAVIFIADEDDCSMSHSSLLGADMNTLGPLQSFRCTRFGITCATGGADSNAMNQVGPKGMCNSNESSAFLTKIGDYVTFFKTLKSDPKNVIVAAIAGTPTPFDVELRAPNGTGTPIPALAHSCSYQGANGPEVADPPVRIKQLLDSFPDRSTYSSICQSDLSGGLTLIAQLLKTVLGSPCIDGNLADVDPNTPGPQYDCSVSDITKFGKPDQVEKVLPQCNNLTTPASSTNLPCWAIEMDAVKCTSASHLILKVERGGTTPADDTHVVSYCVTTAGP